MPVSNTVRRVTYNGDGSTVTFAVPFRFLDGSHLKAVDGAGDELTISSVTGVGDEAGGSVTLSAAPATGTTVTILGNAPLDQQTDYEAGDGLPADVVEKSIDLLTIQNQEQAEKLARSVKFGEGDDTTDVTMATPVPGKALVVSDDGTVIEMSGANYDDVISSAQASATNAANSEAAAAASETNAATSEANAANSAAEAAASAAYTADKLALDGSSTMTGGYKTDNTGADEAPRGTTAQRPTHKAGLIRWNTTLGYLEESTGAAWRAIGSALLGLANVWTKGQATQSYDIGNSGAGTVTPLIANGNIQHMTITGSFTLAKPADADQGYIEIEATVDATGGYSPDISAFTLLSGSLDLTANKINYLRISKHNSGACTLEITQGD